MQTVNLSEVGGLNAEILARMAEGDLVALTSDRVVRAIALPYTENEFQAAEAALNFRDKRWKIQVGRLRRGTLAKLTDKGILTMLYRRAPAAILLPYPRTEERAQRGAAAYLLALGLIE